MTSLALNLIEAVRDHADSIALRLGEVEMSFGGLDAASASLAGLLVTRGLRRGDRVGVMLPNVPYFAAAYYGVLRAGGVVVPMNVLLKERETTFYLSDSQAKAVIAWHECSPAARAGAAAAGAECIVVTPGEFEELIGAAEPVDQPVARDDTDTAVILYTSGTTGTPKGAELTHANLRRNAAMVVELADLVADDVIFGALPLFHAFGQTAGLNAAVAAGSCLTLIPRFDPAKALEIIERDRVTVFEGVPTMFTAIMHSHNHADTSSLRLCVSGGAAMPVEVMRGFEEAFDCMVLEAYGLSETSPLASITHPGLERKPGSIGTPVAGVEMKLVDTSHDGVGEIAIRGHNVMKGYWNRPEATAAAIDADGWFHTGDLARVDDDGYYFIVDRSKDMIIRGGYNVYPREIEEVLYEHPAVREAAVIGVPDELLGEEIGAAVVLASGADADAGGVRDFVKDRVAGYKYPRLVWFLDELPKGPTGKILKRDIVIPEEKTTSIATRPLYDSTDSLLRFAVRADATLTGIIGLAIAFLADPISSLTGLKSFREHGVGIIFVLAGLLVFSLGTLPELRRVGISVVVVNVAFTLAAIVTAEALPLTVTGVALTLAGGAYTAAFAGLQYLGLRRLGA